MVDVADRAGASPRVHMRRTGPLNVFERCSFMSYFASSCPSELLPRYSREWPPPSGDVFKAQSSDRKIARMSRQKSTQRCLASPRSGALDQKPIRILEVLALTRLETQPA
jgi:hypothetical protein